MSAEITFTNIRDTQIQDAMTDLDRYTGSIEKALAAHRAHGVRSSAILQSAQALERQYAVDKNETENTLEEKVRHLEEEIKSTDVLNERRAAALERLLYKEDHNQSLASTGSADRFNDRSHNLDPSQYDDLLKKLGALGMELQNGQGGEEVVKTARQHANEEVFSLVHSCRTHINCKIIEARNAFSVDSSNNESVTESEVQAVQNEIESLWDEVVPVAHMAVEKQLLQPIMRRIGTTAGSKSMHRGMVAAYICACLRYMNGRFQALVSRLEQAEHHQERVSTALMIAEENKLAWKHSQRKFFSQTSAPEQSWRPAPSIEASLHGFSSFPGDVLDSTQTSDDLLVRLDKLIHNRAAKGQDVSNKTQQTWESFIKAELDDHLQTREMVIDCILADSLIELGRPGSALLDAQTEESIATLEQEAVQNDSLLTELGIPGSCKYAKLFKLPTDQKLQRRRGQGHEGFASDGPAHDELTLDLSGVREMIHNFAS